MGIQHPTCPVCGGVIHDDGRVLVDRGGLKVMAGSQEATLTRSEMLTFLALWRERPRVVSHHRLLDATVPPGRDDERDDKILDNWIHKLRRKLNPVGITIETAWGEGYRITLPQPAARAA